MHREKHGSKGFTLVASLMLLCIMSGIAIALLMMVHTEGTVGTQDVQNNLSYHAAEGGIEHMTSDLANMFQNIESPTAAQIEALSSLAPANTAFMSYPVYTLTPATTPGGALATQFGPIVSGPYQGLSAQILPVTLQVTAQGPLGDEVNMTRTVEVALVPVFQFGIFSESDLSFFAGPNLDFNGRVHTNGDLYISEGDGSTLRFHDKVSAYGNVIRWELPDGQATNTPSTHLGNVDLPTASQGCDGAQPACRNMGNDNNNGTNEGSVAINAPPNTWGTGGQNAIWPGISVGTYNSFIIDGNNGLLGGTGATRLNLPFIPGTGPNPGTAQPFEIIRRPPAAEPPTSALGAARLYNEAEIRVLLSDNPDELPCGNPSGPPAPGCGSADPQNIRLANVNLNGNNNAFGVQLATAALPAGLPALGAGENYTQYFATAALWTPDSSQWTNTKYTVGGAQVPINGNWPFTPVAPPGGYGGVNDTLLPAGAPVNQLAGNGNNGLNAAPDAIDLSQCAPNGANPPICPAVGVPFWTGSYPYFYDSYNHLGYTYGSQLWWNNTTNWNLIDGYLRVEYRDAGGAYHPVTSEWLSLGFARGFTPPAAPGANPVNPDAILILQELADRNLDGLLDTQGAPPGSCTKSGGVYSCTAGKPPEQIVDPNTSPGLALGQPYFGESNPPGGLWSPTAFNWYPINFYDAREGESRDVVTGNTSCTPQGVMNAVELDVGNLKRWLAGAIGASGPNVDFLFQNGYVLYYSDRRGMLPNPVGTPPVDPAGTKTGDSGMEDVINTPNQNGATDGALEPIPAGKNQSPEDVNNNTVLDNYGFQNLGLGLAWNVGQYINVNASVNRQIVNAAPAPDPYLTLAGRIPQCNIARANWISGARHALKLVDGSLGNVPVRPDQAFPNSGGFTVGSENPVYIFGDYNTSAADPTWANPNAAEVPHAAAGIIADAVTVLSSNWSDANSLSDASPSNVGLRNASTNYYRAAVASGKNINFPTAGIAWKVGDWGTDGGLHNFLRQLEGWGGQTLNYKGSMVSLYYAAYATGTDKNGGNTTYNPGTRNYIFDPMFTKPQNLPPGTPMFRDIDNLSYRQSFTPHTGCY